MQETLGNAMQSPDADGGDGLQAWWVAADIKHAVTDSRQWVVLQLGAWAGG
jgi:hypothetical protein